MLRFIAGIVKIPIRREMRPSPLAPRYLRIVAYGLDTVVTYAGQLMGAYGGAVIAATLFSVQGAPELLVRQAASQGSILGWLFWGTAVWVLNFGVLQGLTGSTLGKRICRIQVMREDGSAFGVGNSLTRSMCYILSALPFYMGFLAIFWSRQKQGWHDLIAGTIVVRRPKKQATLAEVIPLPAPSEEKAA